MRQHVTLVEDGSAALESESTDDEPAVAAKRGADADDAGQVKRGRQDGAATSAETAETLHDQATGEHSSFIARPGIFHRGDDRGAARELLDLGGGTPRTSSMRAREDWK